MSKPQFGQQYGSFRNLPELIGTPIITQTASSLPHILTPRLSPSRPVRDILLCRSNSAINWLISCALRLKRINKVLRASKLVASFVGTGQNYCCATVVYAHIPCVGVHKWCGIRPQQNSSFWRPRLPPTPAANRVLMKQNGDRVGVGVYTGPATLFVFPASIRRWLLSHVKRPDPGSAPMALYSRDMRSAITSMRPYVLASIPSIQNAAGSNAAVYALPSREGAQNVVAESFYSRVPSSSHSSCFTQQLIDKACGGWASIEKTSWICTPSGVLSLGRNGNRMIADAMYGLSLQETLEGVGHHLRESASVPSLKGL